jgi:dCTP diphosphatase
MTDVIDVIKIQKIMKDFTEARDWNKFHSPKNIAMALAAESGELLEIFQWLTEQESFAVKDVAELKERVEHEIADISLYLIRLAGLLDININSAIENKITLNNKKYPAELVKGSAKKYNEY